MGVSADNGNIAYTCSQNGVTGPVEVDKTWNDGASWTRMANLNQPWDGCGNVIVDALNPAIAIMDGMANQNNVASTHDGGQTWQVSGVPSIGYVGELASVGARTYGLSVGSDRSYTLAVSVDGLVTWRDISGPMARQGLTAFWANPYTGALLAETTPSFLSPVTLWRSSDGGAHWSSDVLPFPVAGALVAKAATGAAPWTLCLDRWRVDLEGSASAG
jgi:hypothetical protein